MHPVGPTEEVNAAGAPGGPDPAPPLRTILVGTDLSYDSHSALKAAGHLLPPDAGEIHVVHVLPRRDAWLLQPGDSAPEAEQAPSDESDISDDRARLARHVEDARLNRELQLHVRVGRPFQVIKATAEEVAADLIVLGRHNPRRAFDGLLGSTAERVVRTAKVPCLPVNRPLEATPRRIMVATDLSPHSERAAQVAVAWANQWATNQHSQGPQAGRHVHVDLVSIADYARPSYQPLERAGALQRQEKAVSEAAGDAVKVKSRVVSFPLAPEGIHEIAEELGVDLVFMGTHGHGPVLRHLFGSVTSEVIRTLPLPVVIIPLPEKR
jgi:universal stress protein E